MSNLHDSNYIYSLKEGGKIKKFFQELEVGDRFEATCTIFEDSLVGTCMETPDSILEAYGLSREFLTELGVDVDKAVDEVAEECEVCGWWYEAGVPCCVEDGICPDCGDCEEECECGYFC